MSTFKARGIVLKQIDYKENDKILTLLLKDYGKTIVYVKGARKPKSKFITTTDIFSYSDFVIYNQNNFNSLTQVDLIENFYDLRLDYDCFYTGVYLLELTEKNILEKMECDKILLLLLYALNHLKNKGNPKLIRAVFELKLLQLLGYEPESHSCHICNEEYEKYFFSDNGIVCESCKGSLPAIPVTYSCLYSMRYIFENDNVYNFSVSDETVNNLLQVSNLMINSHLNNKIKSKSFL